MSKKKLFVLALFVAWAALFIGSYYAAAYVDGPRNLDTGLARLDTLVRFQIAAFGFALTAGALGFVWRDDGGRIMLIGLLPLLTTLVLAGSIAISLLVFKDRTGPVAPPMPPKPVTAPANQ